MLSDKAAGLVKLNSGVGSAIGGVLPIEGVTAIPFRTSGTFAKTGTTLDAELLAKNLIDTVRPDKVIERLPELIPGGIPRLPTSSRGRRKSPSLRSRKRRSQSPSRSGKCDDSRCGHRSSSAWAYPLEHHASCGAVLLISSVACTAPPPREVGLAGPGDGRQGSMSN